MLCYVYIIYTHWCHIIPTLVCFRLFVVYISGSNCRRPVVAYTDHTQLLLSLRISLYALRRFTKAHDSPVCSSRPDHRDRRAQQLIIKRHKISACWHTDVNDYLDATSCYRRSFVRRTGLSVPTASASSDTAISAAPAIIMQQYYDSCSWYHFRRLHCITWILSFMPSNMQVLSGACLQG